MNSRKTFKKNQTKSKEELEKIKSDYFLQKIIEFMHQYKTLEIMKYNKRLQKRLNLTIKDYEKYSQLYSSIEIELKLVDNKYGDFINIPKNEIQYYHIYFDNATEEIKRNYLQKNEKVNMINIKIDYQVKSFKELFFNCKCISSINFKKFTRINITNMGGMFCACSSLKELNISNFNTNNVTDMSDMFKGCKLNISNFNINPLASPCAEAPALKYGDANTATTSSGEVKGLIFAYYIKKNLIF